MTGHPGERRNREVALVTDDFALYHRLVPFFARNGQAVVVLKPGEAVPASVRALLAGPAGDARTVPLREDLEATLLACHAHLDRRADGSGYRKVVLGVDPGKVIGLAAVADGRSLLVGESRSVEEAIARLAAWTTGLPSAPAAPAIHIGSGAPEVGTALYAGLRRRLPKLKVSLVSEEATTPWSPVTGSRHTDAAIHIAQRSP
jgi:hypothetical protein